MAGQIFDVKESGIKPCYNIATMGKFRPLHNPLLNGLLSRNTRSPKTYGKDSIICTESQKLNLQRKGMAEGGGVCARLIKVRLGLENLFQAQLQVATHLSPPTLSPLYSHCTRLAAPRLARVTTTQVQQHWIVALCSKAWPLAEHAESSKLDWGAGDTNCTPPEGRTSDWSGQLEAHWSAGKYRHFGDFHSNELTSWVIIN